MNISKVAINRDGFENIEELYRYLSKIVIAKSDEIVNKEHSRYEETKLILQSRKEELRSLSEGLKNAEKDVARYKILKRILDSINTLKRESLLTDKRKSKVSSYLVDINQKSFSDLREIEEELSIFFV